VREGRDIPSPPEPGRVSLRAEPGLSAAYYAAAGYGLAGPLAIRIDILERMIGELRRLAHNGRFTVPAELLNLAGCGPDDMAGVLAALGYRREETPDGPRFAPPDKRGKRPRKTRRDGQRRDADSPFAKLKDAAVT
jgi:ATP-dependent RNA helicase SUPV3L1/SUV3